MKINENHIMGHNIWNGSDRDFWLQNVPYIMALLHAFLRHVTSNKMNNFQKNVFLQIVMVKGQTQGQGQIKVKGQGNLEIFTILYVIDAI